MGDISQYWDLVKQKSAEHKLDPCLVSAIILTESGGDEAAVRFEPAYRWLYTPDKVRPASCSKNTEQNLQKTSWGLMQIMGAVARERGFRGWLTLLLQPENNIEYGCRHVRHLFDRPWDMSDVIAAYNFGSPIRTPSGAYRNQRYVDSVLGYFKNTKARQND